MINSKFSLTGKRLQHADTFLSGDYPNMGTASWRPGFGWVVRCVGMSS